MKDKMCPPKSADEKFGEVLEQLEEHNIGIMGIDDKGVYMLKPVYSGSESAEGSQSAVSGFRKIPAEFVVGKYQENYMRYSFVAKHLRWLMGEILTVIDATIDDERKLKATKDLIKNRFSDKLDWVYTLAGKPLDEEVTLGLEED